MKQQWIKFTTRIDAMTLRERAMVFVCAVGVMVFVMYALALEPLFERQKTLLAQIKQQQNQVMGIDGEITARIAGAAADPDADTKIQLSGLQQQAETLGASLRAVQRGLVPPERMVPLLEQMLRANARLRLLSLKTLPVSGLSEGLQADAKAEGTAAAGKPLGDVSGGAEIASLAAASVTAQTPAGTDAKPAVKPRELLYRHGVEMELQGSYLDMVNYMAALEALPVQLFWGKARLDAQQYPSVKLTLTLYTLSLDRKWMKL